MKTLTFFNVELEGYPPTVNKFRFIAWQIIVFLASNLL